MSTWKHKYKQKVKDDFAQGLKEQHEAMIELGTRPCKNKAIFVLTKQRAMILYIVKYSICSDLCY